MTATRVIDAIVNTDRRLEREANDSTKALAHWRWRHTLDESNPDTISLTRYAELVGRARETIRTYARGYEIWRDDTQRGDDHMSITDAINRARMGEDTHIAAQAIAEVRGTSPGTVHRGQHDVLRRVRDEARHRASARGTSLADEARQVAREVARPIQTDEDEATSYLNGAARELAHALAARERAGVSNETAERDAFQRVERYLAAYRQAIEGVPFEDTVQDADRRWLEDMGVTL